MSTLLFGYVSEVTDPAQLLADDNYIAEEKLNGMRLQLIKTANVVTGYTRQGIEWELPIRTREAAMMTADSYHVDGELLPSGEFVCFDVLSYKGADLRTWMNHSRLQFEISLPFRFARRAVDTGKQTLLDTIKAEGGEGVVFKRWTAPYQYDYGFKYKFYRSETFRIVSVDIAKNTATIERAGKVMGSVTFARDTWPRPGQMCEVRFDGISSPSGKLLRPKWLGIRVDVDAATLETPIAR